MMDAGAPPPAPPRPHSLTVAEDFLAGSAAGVASLVVGHPFDLVKVRIQTAAGAMRQTSAVQHFVNNIRNEGILGMYKGMAAPLVTVPLINAIVFASFAQAKARILAGEDRPMTALEATVAGSFAGAVNSVVVSPIELIKCRLQIQTAVTAYTGVIDCIVQVGFRGLFQGMSATIVREVPCYAAQFYTYESLKNIASRDGKERLGMLEQLVIGGLAGVACWTASYPQDSVKSMLQVHGPGSFSRHRWIPDGGFIEAWRYIVRREGMRGLWRGFGPCIVRAFPANAAGFFAYETCRRYLLGSKATTVI